MTQQDDRAEFATKRASEIKNISNDKNLSQISHEWFMSATNHRYSYHFDWLGLPIIQFPQDMVAIQEIMWRVKPDIIIETGIARGGSLIFSASMLHLLNNNGKVIGIDIDIRPHNREAIESHPLSSYITLIEGSSTDRDIVEKVNALIKPSHQVLIILDSNHTHDHVHTELELYSPLVTKDSYLIVMDTVIEHMPENTYLDRPWAKGNNPKTAVHAFLKNNNRFEIDYYIQDKLLLTVAHDGYLKCIL